MFLVLIIYISIQNSIAGSENSKTAIKQKQISVTSPEIINGTKVKDTDICTYKNFNGELLLAEIDDLYGKIDADTESGFPHVWLRSSGKLFGLTDFKVNYEYNDYLQFVRTDKKMHSVCSAEFAWNVGNDWVGFLFEYDNMTGPRYLKAAFFNFKSDEVVKVKFLGGFKEVTKLGDGSVSFYEIPDYVENVSETILIHKKSFTADENILPVWRKIVFDPTKREVTSKSNRLETYRKSGLKEIFTSQTEFEKYFGYDDKSDNYLNRYFFGAKEISDPNKYVCVQQSKNHVVQRDEKAWRCRL